MESLLGLHQDIMASTQAQELGKASVPSNVHVIWDLHGAVFAEPS